MLSDLKYAFRQLIKRPGFTTVAVLILALGIASNTAVFTVIDTLLLRGLPVGHPEELMGVSSKGATPTSANSVELFPYALFEQFRDHAQSLAGAIAFRQDGRSLIASGFSHNDIVPVSTNLVSGNFFPVLGVPAVLGRTLAPDDDQADAPRAVVVLSYAFWQRQFGADPAVLGKTVLVDNVQVAIVGVAAPGFSGAEVGSPIDLWLPLHLETIFLNSPRLLQEPGASGAYWLRLMCRLQPEVKRKAANAELNVIFQEVLANAGVSPKVREDYGKIELQPGGSGFIAGRAQVASMLDILMIVVGMVLVIACANVASLLLARTAVRQREFALRTALGAGRGRLIRQLLIESLLLAAAGGSMGFLLAHWGTLVLAAYLPIGASLNLSPDGRVLSFTAVASVVTGVLAGLLPALRFSRLNLVTALKDQAGTLAGGSSQRLNKALVMAQIALSVCLLAGAGLFVRTLENLRNVDLGVNRRNLLLAHVPFEKGDDATRRAILSKDLLAALEGLPGVRGDSFFWGSGGLLSGHSVGSRGFGNIDFSVDGYVPKQDEQPPAAYAVYVGPRFFETMGLPLLRGHGFELADVFPVGSPPIKNNIGGVVINESIARKYFGNSDPIGRVIRMPHPQLMLFKIIGVAKNTKELNLRDDSLFEIYLPCSAIPGPPDGITLALRTSNNPLSLSPSVRSMIHTTAPKLPNPFFNTIDNAVDRSLSQERMIAQTAGLFSVFALLLASLGLYGVLAYNVTQRTREIGVRMALGARSGNIISLILRQGMGLALIGCVAGTGAAMALAHLIASRLYGIPALDPFTFLLTAAVLLTVALLACWLPARRATKVDPMVALRAE